MSARGRVHGHGPKRARSSRSTVAEAEPPQPSRPGAIRHGDRVVLDEAVPTGYPAGDEPTMLSRRPTMTSGAAPGSDGRHLVGLGPATTSVRPWKWSSDPVRKRENRAVARFLKPSAGLEPATPPYHGGPAMSRLPLQRPKPLHKATNLLPQHGTATGTFRHPPLPTGTRAWTASAHGLAPSGGSPWPTAHARDRVTASTAMVEITTPKLDPAARVIFVPPRQTASRRLTHASGTVWLPARTR